MDVKTGDILAMADLPATSGSAATGATATRPPVAPTGSPSTSGPTLVSQADTLPAGVEEAPSNSAVTQVYEPGSVFKLVTFSAALADGVITPNQVSQRPRRRCPWGRTPSTTPSTTAPSASRPPQILAQSSNIGTIEIAQELGRGPAARPDRQPRVRPADRARLPR